MARRGKVESEHFNYFRDLMRQIEWDLHQEVLDKKRIPSEWHEIAKAKGQAEKVRLTLRVDADVVRFFRKFGKGYQQRMNDVMAAWMHGRLAALIKGPDAKDVSAAITAGFDRPRIGEMEMFDRGFICASDGTIRRVDTGEVVSEEEAMRTPD